MHRTAEPGQTWQVDLVSVSDRDPLNLRVLWLATRGGGRAYGGEQLHITAIAGPSGRVRDVQVTSSTTTCPPELDELVARETVSLIAFSRATHTVSRWDRRRRKRPRP